MEKFLVSIIVLFFVFETVNWFILQTIRTKVVFQSHPCTEQQAKRMLRHVRLIYFWLSSDYYWTRMQDTYAVVVASPDVSNETKRELYKSLHRRFVKNLVKV